MDCEIAAGNCVLTVNQGMLLNKCLKFDRRFNKVIFFMNKFSSIYQVLAHHSCYIK